MVSESVSALHHPLMTNAPHMDGPSTRPRMAADIAVIPLIDAARLRLQSIAIMCRRPLHPILIPSGATMASRRLLRLLQGRSPKGLEFYI